MKLFLTMILMLFASIGQSAIINCEFKMLYFTSAKYVYGCLTTKVASSGNLEKIEELQGTHMAGKANKDVLGFNEIGASMQYIPSNFADFFPNLVAIALWGPLLRLTASDLKPFPNLLQFTSSFGRFTSIEGDLFQYTTKLKIIQINNGKLENVGSNLLSGCNDLEILDFRKHTCIDNDRWADTPALIQQLKQKLFAQCPPLPQTTTAYRTTTKLATTTKQPACNIRCSMNSEFDELWAKVENQEKNITYLQTTTSVLVLKNEKQNEKIAQLDEKITDIAGKNCEFIAKIKEICARR